MVLSIPGKQGGRKAAWAEQSVRTWLKPFQHPKPHPDFPKKKQKKGAA